MMIYQIGTITKSYDPIISSQMPFPSGFLHDLSLITDSELPQFVSPPGIPQITGWAEYSAVLDDGPILVCRMNLLTGVRRNLEGQKMSGAAQLAVVAGP